MSKPIKKSNLNMSIKHECSNCNSEVSNLFQFDLCKKCLLETFKKYELKNVIDSVRK